MENIVIFEREVPDSSGSFTVVIVGVWYGAMVETCGYAVLVFGDVDVAHVFANLFFEFCREFFMEDAMVAGDAEVFGHFRRNVTGESVEAVPGFGVFRGVRQCSFADMEDRFVSIERGFHQVSWSQCLDGDV